MMNGQVPAFGFQRPTTLNFGFPSSGGGGGGFGNGWVTPGSTTPYTPQCVDMLTPCSTPGSEKKRKGSFCPYVESEYRASKFFTVDDSAKGNVMVDGYFIDTSVQSYTHWEQEATETEFNEEAMDSQEFIGQFPLTPMTPTGFPGGFTRPSAKAKRGWTPVGTPTAMTPGDAPTPTFEFAFLNQANKEEDEWASPSMPIPKFQLKRQVKYNEDDWDDTA